MSIVTGDRAKEIEADSMVDALVDGNGDASWQVSDEDYKPVNRTPKASILAIAMSDAYQAYKLEGVIGVQHNMLTDRVEVQVRKEYFDAHYTGDIELIERPEQKYIQYGVKVGDAYVFCIEFVEFKMVRV